MRNWLVVFILVLVGCSGADGRDGAPGKRGPEGVRGPGGEDGSSCTVEDNGDGTSTLSCEDGSSVIIPIGTSGEGMGPISETCVQRQGTYRVQYQERSGDCGPMTEQMVTMNGQPETPGDSCTGEILYSADNCEVANVNVKCPVEDVGEMVFNAKMDWSLDGSTGQGEQNVILYDTYGEFVCQSSYDVAIKRL